MIDLPKSLNFIVRLERPEGTLTFRADEDEYLLYSMVDAGIETPYVCEQGWCLACAARLVSGEVDRQGLSPFILKTLKPGLYSCARPNLAPISSWFKMNAKPAVR